MAQSVKLLTSAQVMISLFMSLSPTSGSVLTPQTLEPSSDSVSPSLSAPSPPVFSLSLPKINKHLKFFKNMLRMLKEHILILFNMGNARKSRKIKDT